MINTAFARQNEKGGIKNEKLYEISSNYHAGRIISRMLDQFR